ncbi:hypothetical protein ACWIGI_16870 [Nocardia sp. NPDC055321]
MTRAVATIPGPSYRGARKSSAPPVNSHPESPWKKVTRIEFSHRVEHHRHG